VSDFHRTSAPLRRVEEVNYFFVTILSTQLEKLVTRCALTRSSFGKHNFYMELSHSISILIPALNEEENIEAAINTAKISVSKYFDDYEILVFNDGSTDKTGEIVDRLAKLDSRIKVTHHNKPKNLGGVYKAALAKASKTYLLMIPGDNENPASAIEPVLAEAGNADIIVPYTSNQEVRPPMRRLLSKSFVTLLNLASGCRLRYYNGTVLQRVDLLRQIKIQTDGFGYQAEALIKLLKKKCTFKEIPIAISAQTAGRRSRAFNIKNLVTVGKFLVSVMLDC
jgi:dolichol-phosphate mannosyltransferase